MSRNPARLSFHIIALLISAVILFSAGCQVKTPSQPILLGSFPDVKSNMQQIYRYDPTGKSLLPVVTKASNIAYLESITYHNYTSVFSPDSQLMAVDVMDPEGFWDLKIYNLSSADPKLVATAQIGLQLSRLREGFSTDGKFYGFTFTNDQTNALDMGIIDLGNNGTLLSLPFAHFIDFSTDGQAVVQTFDDKGAGTGVVKFDPATQKTTNVFQPAKEIKLGMAILSPDQKWIIFSDLQGKTLNRVPLAGGMVEKIYDYTGNNTAVNYDRSGQYLIVLDLGTDAQILKLFDRNFKEIYSLVGIGTTTMDFSSDGRFFAYQLFGQGSMELYLTDFTARTYFSIANSGILYKLDISPDNKYLAYLSVANNVEHAGTLFLVSLKDLKSTKIDTNITSFKFNNDNSLLYVKLDDTDQQSSLFQIPFGSSVPVPLIENQPGILFLIH